MTDNLTFLSCIENIVWININMRIENTSIIAHILIILVPERIEHFVTLAR